MFICLILGGKGPVILEHMNDAYAKPGASSDFECRVVGEPLPHITWYVLLQFGCEYVGEHTVDLRISRRAV